MSDIKDTQATGTTVDPVAPNEGTPTGEQTFTQAQLDAIIGQRLGTEKEKQAEATKKAIEDALAEERRQQALTQEQRDQENERARRQELKEREDNLTIRENRLKAQELLSAKGVPVDMADFVVDLDISKMEANVEKLAQSYNQSVEAGVTDKLKGKAPEDFTNPPKDTKKKTTPTTAF